MESIELYIESTDLQKGRLMECIEPGLDLATDSVNANLGQTWVGFVCADAYFKHSQFLNYFFRAIEAEESDTMFSNIEGEQKEN